MKFENEIDPERRKKPHRPKTVAQLRQSLDGLPDDLPLADRYELIVTTIMRRSGRDKLALAIREE
jgi:hypothetical protein